ncbi:glycosyltransferase [Anaerolineae bacterium CFX7]|nr:glycosyltransferase [Anaerolineae bacterium CFX7]
MEQPTFSICIPNYNYARYIGETIQSVLAQTYPKFEIIVADNASTDNSVQVVESFKDSRIRLIRNRYNIGFAPNLQRATMYATGDFINLLSSDDLMRRDALETCAAILNQQGVKAQHTVLMSDVDLVNALGEVVGYETRVRNSFESLTRLGNPNEVDSTDNLAAMELYRGRDVLRQSLAQLRNFAPFLSVIYPRQLWEAVEGYNSVRTIGPDKHFHYKLLAQDPDVAYIRRRLFAYRVHGSPNQQAQQTNLKQQIDDYLYTLEYADDFLAEYGLQRRDLIDILLNRVCLKNGLTQLVHGTFEQAFRMWAFALAAYPKTTLRLSKFYFLTGLLLLGPLARIVARPFYNRYHRRELERLGIDD